LQSTCRLPADARKDRNEKWFPAVISTKGRLHFEGDLPPMMRHQSVIKKMVPAPLMQKYGTIARKSYERGNRGSCEEKPVECDFAHRIGNERVPVPRDILKQRGNGRSSPGA